MIIILLMKDSSEAGRGCGPSRVGVREKLIGRGRVVLVRDYPNKATKQSAGQFVLVMVTPLPSEARLFNRPHSSFLPSLAHRPGLLLCILFRSSILSVLYILFGKGSYINYTNTSQLLIVFRKLYILLP